MKFIIGIDEVGRGSLAGPVVVAAVCVRGIFRPARSARKLGKLKDSKKLTKLQRVSWFEYLKESEKVHCALARAYPKTIDKFNISNAANRAARKAFKKLVAALGLRRRACRVFLDGGLFLTHKKYRGKEQWPDGGLFSPKTVVKGDEKITAIKLASIMAKVSRDKFMSKLSKIYPQYGFDIHKGYGTRIHREAIAKFGPAPVHRLTFMGKYLKIQA